ncbi:MAG TPA: hypothetical protein VHD33_03875 [Legionellaceae bacterium]|nr:hypothetical protein [Legionellaceae bacterium]
MLSKICASAGVFAAARQVASKTVMVSLPHKKANATDNLYPVTITGTGSVPCLTVGLGTLLLNTASETFFNHFKLFSSDLYWHQNNALENANELTMESISSDVGSIATQLQLASGYILMAHSCFGMVALEHAKQDKRVQGVVLVASPPAWNADMWEKAKRFFENNADQGRKDNNAARVAHYELIKKPNDSELSMEKYISDTARYWANYEIDDDTIKSVWNNVEADDNAANRFFVDLLPEYHLENDLEKVNCPIFLAAGPFDYDCIPLELWRDHPAAKKLDNKLTIVECPNSGHWPNYEDREIFDTQLFDWVKRHHICDYEHEDEKSKHALGV